MKIREFVKIEQDIDVYDNVVEELAIAFCGPLKLKPEGKRKFAEVLEYDIESDPKYGTAIVNVDFDDWKDRLKKAKEFFYAAAGYCADEDWNKWFKEN